MRLLVLFALLGTLTVTQADTATGHWIFQKPLDVTPETGKKIYHHLESSGRRNIAVSGQQVAVTWEDDRDGTPRIYWTIKPIAANSFPQAIQVSGQGEAFEPAIAVLTDGRFIIAWEEDMKVYARIASAKGLGPIARITQKESGQPSLVESNGDAIVVYSELSGRHRRIMLSRITLQRPQELVSSDPCVVDPEPHKDEQLYPTASMSGDRLLVAWEDRRPGHTIIMVTQAAPGNSCQWSKPVRISEAPRGPKRAYGQGHGVARVVLAPYGKSNVFAAWADKRDFREGYDIYGADKRGKKPFGANVRVQDDFGEVARQWHPAVAGHPKGRLVAVWDDERDGNADIMLSWLESRQWSEDSPVPGASGPGEQAHPSIALDDKGGLHLAWVERKAPGGATRLRYAYGRIAK